MLPFCILVSRKEKKVQFSTQKERTPIQFQVLRLPTVDYTFFYLLLLALDRIASNVVLEPSQQTHRPQQAGFCLLDWSKCSNRPRFRVREREPKTVKLKALSEKRLSFFPPEDVR